MQNRKLGKQNRGYTKDTVKTIKQLKEIQKNLLSKKYSKQRKKITLETEEDCYYKCEFCLVVADIKE